VNQAWLNNAKSRLLAEKAHLIAAIASSEKNSLSMSESGSTGELSAYDNHPADLGTETFDRSKDLGLKDNACVLLDQVEKALAAVDDGTYGQCDVCQKPIPLARLEAVPWATTCIDCARKTGRVSEDRPLEEKVLTPPFYRTYRGKHGDSLGYTGFDGEDAWQAVAQYGTSSTPQDEPGTANFGDLTQKAYEEANGIAEPGDRIAEEKTPGHFRQRQELWGGKPQK